VAARRCPLLRRCSATHSCLESGPVFQRRFVHSDNVLGRHLGLDVVDGRQNISAARGQVLGGSYTGSVQNRVEQTFVVEYPEQSAVPKIGNRLQKHLRPRTSRLSTIFWLTPAHARDADEFGACGIIATPGIIPFQNSS